MGLIALILSTCALLSCVYLYLELQKKLSKHDVGGELLHASEELSKSYKSSVKQIEVEWDNMYAKFAKLAGRMDRERALKTQEEPADNENKPISRSDLLRGRRLTR